MQTLVIFPLLRLNKQWVSADSRVRFVKVGLRSWAMQSTAPWHDLAAKDPVVNLLTSQPSRIRTLTEAAAWANAFSKSHTPFQIRPLKVVTKGLWLTQDEKFRLLKTSKGWCLEISKPNIYLSCTEISKGVVVMSWLRSWISRHRLDELFHTQAALINRLEESLSLDAPYIFEPTPNKN